MVLSRVLVSDFDGTMTDRDFYSLVVERLLPPDMPDYWVDYRSRKLTHFEALQKYFAAIRKDEASVLKLVDQMGLDPGLKESVTRLAESGWKVVIASAGCRWYIDKLLAAANIEPEIHANPGRFVPGRGLLMELPIDSPFFGHSHGIRKAAVVEHFLQAGYVVAFAGDGFPDVDAAKLVPADLRFARRDLADVLRSEGEAFTAYRTWSDIAERLLELSPP